MTITNIYKNNEFIASAVFVGRLYQDLFMQKKFEILTVQFQAVYFTVDGYRSYRYLQVFVRFAVLQPHWKTAYEDSVYIHYMDIYKYGQRK